MTVRTMKPTKQDERLKKAWCWDDGLEREHRENSGEFAGNAVDEGG